MTFAHSQLFQAVTGTVFNELDIKIVNSQNAHFDVKFPVPILMFFHTLPVFSNSLAQRLTS
eukprot:8096748-Karenia_brevis.AAC.1